MKHFHLKYVLETIVFNFTRAQLNFSLFKNIDKNLYEEISYGNMNKKGLTMITFLCKHDQKKR